MRAAHLEHDLVGLGARAVRRQELGRRRRPRDRARRSPRAGRRRCTPRPSRARTSRSSGDRGRRAPPSARRCRPPRRRAPSPAASSSRSTRPSATRAGRGTSGPIASCAASCERLRVAGELRLLLGVHARLRRARVLRELLGGAQVRARRAGVIARGGRLLAVLEDRHAR